MNRRDMVEQAAATRAEVVRLRAAKVGKAAIAAQLGISPGAVAGHVFRAKQEADRVKVGLPPRAANVSGNQPRKPVPAPVPAEAPKRPPPASTFQPRRCCWPTWDKKDEAYWASIARGEAVECGDSVQAGHIYCAVHVERATNKWVPGRSPASAASPSMTAR